MMDKLMFQAPRLTEDAFVSFKNGSKEDDSFDDAASTCAPSSVDLSSFASTPDMGPIESPFADSSVDSLLALLPDNSDAQVCIVHHDDMQLHRPPRSQFIPEQPRRIIAIESSLKGHAARSHVPRRNWGNAPMKFFRQPRECDDGKSRSLVVAYGASAAKKRRVSNGAVCCGAAMEGSVWEACHVVEAPIVKDSDLRLVHSKRHIAEVTDLCGMAVEMDASFYPLTSETIGTPKNLINFINKRVNDDVYYSPQSLAAMKRAAGGAVEAVRQLFQTDPKSGLAVGRSSIESSFAIVRPPGHHCCTAPNGFCFFNNTAIATSHARQVLGLSRVAIVDWDYHHGDGQQTTFYKDPSVLTISLHVAMERTRKGEDLIAFPGNRGMDVGANGSGQGKGYNINIPWPHDQVGPNEYQKAFETIVIPALQAFDPELIMVASGFDAVKGDMLAGTRLPPRSYYHLTRQLLSLRKPVAVILEGGYSPELLAQGSLNVTNALLGRAPPPSNDVAATSSAPESKGLDWETGPVLDAVRRRLNTLPPWKAMSRPGSDRYFHEDASPTGPGGRDVARELHEKIMKQAQKP